MNHAQQHHTTADARPELPGNLTMDTHAASIRHFRGFVADPANKPSQDPSYGTKHPGRITLLHFMFYAILRGKSPESTSHDPKNSEKYQSALRQLYSLTQGGNEALLRELHQSFGLTDHHIVDVLKTFTW